MSRIPAYPRDGIITIDLDAVTIVVEALAPLSVPGAGRSGNRGKCD